VSVRGHIGVYDFQQGVKKSSGAAALKDIVFMTMLRDPVARVISEYIHVRRRTGGRSQALPIYH